MQLVSPSLLSDVCPSDVLKHIFSYADGRSLLHLISTCKRFKLLLEGEASKRIWQLYVHYCHPYAASYLSKEGSTKQWIDLTRCCVSLDEKVATGHLPANFFEPSAKRRWYAAAEAPHRISASLRKEVQLTSKLGSPVIEISDIDTNHIERMITVKDARFCIDGDTLYLGSVHRPCIEAWDLETGEKGKTYRIPPGIEKTDLKLYPQEETFFYAVVNPNTLLVWDKTSETPKYSIPIQDGFQIEKILFIQETNHAYLFRSNVDTVEFVEFDLESKQMSPVQCIGVIGDFVDARIENGILFIHSCFGRIIKWRPLKSNKEFKSCHAYCFFNNTLMTFQPAKGGIIVQRNLEDLDAKSVKAFSCDLLNYKKETFIEISPFSPTSLLVQSHGFREHKFFIIDFVKNSSKQLNIDKKGPMLDSDLTRIGYVHPPYSIPSIIQDYVLQTLSGKMRSIDEHPSAPAALPSSIHSLYHSPIKGNYVKVALAIPAIAAFCFFIMVAAPLMSLYFSLWFKHFNVSENDLVKKIGISAISIIPVLHYIPSFKNRISNSVQSWVQKKVINILDHFETIPGRS